MTPPSLAGVRAVVITCSTRAATGVYPDRGGPILAEALGGWGADVVGPVVVADGPPVLEALGRAAAEADLVLTTGGTGVSPSDRTPEMTRQVCDREIPGIAEEMRRVGVQAGVPTAMLSRGLAGLAGRCLVVNLPGSTGGVRDGLAVLESVLPHVLSQLRGEDH